MKKNLQCDFLSSIQYFISHTGGGQYFLLTFCLSSNASSLADSNDGELFAIHYHHLRDEDNKKYK